MVVPLSVSVDRRGHWGTRKLVMCWVEARRGCPSPRLHNWRTHSAPKLMGSVADKSLRRICIRLKRAAASQVTPLPRAPWIQWLNDTWVWRPSPLPQFKDSLKGHPGPRVPWDELKLSKQLKCNSTSPSAQSCSFDSLKVLITRILLHTDLSQSLLPGERTYATCPKSKS